jgi:tRNA pseudouridine55 synthase
MASKREITGVLLLDKPVGLTSNATIGRVRHLFNAAKAGHTGTLDPFATGLLPTALGEASKFSRFLLDATKGYSATLKLGVTTTTGDPEGEIVEQRSVHTTAQNIAMVLNSFRGAQKQTPPMHSALKRNGVPLYKLARQGVEVAREARSISIDSLRLRAWDEDRLEIDVTCSKGTYIRVLAQDIGAALGCGAHLIGLRRTRVGRYDIGRALTLDALGQLDCAGRDAMLLPPDSLAADLPALHLDASQTLALRNGRRIACEICPSEDGEYRLYGFHGDFLGVGQIAGSSDGASLVAVRMMSNAAPAEQLQPREFT